MTRNRPSLARRGSGRSQRETVVRSIAFPPTGLPDRFAGSSVGLVIEEGSARLSYYSHSEISLV